MSRYAITTFGCQMNVHDSERMHEVLRAGGYSEVEAEGDADVVVLNTCSVREKAEQKLLSELGRLVKLKRTRPELTIVVAGCVAQQEGEKLLKRAQGIDLLIGPDNIVELPRLLQEIALGGPPVARTVFDVDDPRFLMATSVGASSKTAFVTIMKGCDERCSFCIVPYTRGPERYRKSGEIVAEIRALASLGVAEVTLLGQTVNSYADPLGALPKGSEDPDESEFAELLRLIAREVPELRRLRYTSPHPRHLTSSLIAAHADLPVLPRHVHMPVQSGSDRMLKRMIRRYTRAEYVERIKALRAHVPDLTLSTDVIVGFPGETEQDFQLTLSLVEEVGFTGLFGFKYSERPYTAAKRLDDNVPEDVKTERLLRLFQVSERLLRAHLESLTGTEQLVLVESTDKRDKEDAVRWTGRTERNEIVHIADAAEFDLLGELCRVEIVRANKHSLEGRLPASGRAVLKKRDVGKPEPRVRRSLPMVVEAG